MRCSLATGIDRCRLAAVKMITVLTAMMVMRGVMGVVGILLHDLGRVTESLQPELRNKIKSRCCKIRVLDQMVCGDPPCPDVPGFPDLDPLFLLSAWLLSSLQFCCSLLM